MAEIVPPSTFASWNGNSWNILGPNSTNNGVNGQVTALAMNGTNQLFVGGSFSNVDGESISANYIASWDGNSWSAGTGTTGTIYAFAINGTSGFFVGGQFPSANGICTSNVAEVTSIPRTAQQSSIWHPISGGAGATIFGLANNGTDVFVGGYFANVDGGTISANRIASWNGNSWNFLGSNSTNNGVIGEEVAEYVGEFVEGS